MVLMDLQMTKQSHSIMVTFKKLHPEWIRLWKHAKRYTTKQVLKIGDYLTRLINSCWIFIFVNTFSTDSYLSTHFKLVKYRKNEAPTDWGVLTWSHAVKYTGKINWLFRFLIWLIRLRISWTFYPIFTTIFD